MLKHLSAETARLHATRAPSDAEASAEDTAAGAAPPHADGGDLHRLRERIERQFRTNRTLGRLVERLAADKAAPTPVEITPRLPLASLSQHPARRAGAAADPWWSAASELPQQPLAALPGYDCYSLAGDAEVVGVSVFGLRGEDLDRVVQSVADEQLRTRDFRPLFLTDQPEVQPFVSRGYAFEYVPGFRAYLVEDLEALREEKRRLLAQKWGITRFVNRDDVRRLHRDHPPLAALLKHNAEMSRACHHDRLGWVIETLRIALATERYDVVAGLSDYLLAFYDRLGKANQVLAARVLCRKFIAFGELERLRPFLFKNIGHVKKDDVLFTLFSVHCSAATEFSKEFAVLPGGKPNSYYLSKRMAVAADHILPSLMAAGEGSTTAGNLLLANYFARQRDPGLFKMFVNRVIGKGGGATLSRVTLGRANVLGHLAFEKQPPSARQHQLVSVVMSAHNAADTILYAARSILAQTHANLELLICDDASSDQTRALLDQLRRDPRVRLFRSHRQQGTYAIRNNLIAEARGTYVTFQDADDYAFPDRLERQLAYLEDHGAAAVVAQWFRITPEGEFVFSTDHSVARLAVVSLFAHKAVFERFGPYRTARFGADTEFYEKLRMQLGTEAVRLMPTPLIFGLAAANSLTRTAGIEASEDGFRAPARRAYAAAASRQRQIGGDVRGIDAIDDVLAAHGVLMRDAGVEPLMENEQ